MLIFLEYCLEVITASRKHKLVGGDLAVVITDQGYIMEIFLISQETKGF